MNRFTSTATHSGRRWVVQCDQHPGALSQVHRLDQAADRQREAISIVTGIEESEIDVVVTPVLDQEVVRSLSKAREDRLRAEELARSASERTRRVAKTLTESGMSVRDAAFVLGDSHQRVSQLTN